MAILRIRYKGKIHSRTVTRNFRGWFTMFSKGKEYRFEKDEFLDDHYGWHVVGQHQMEDEFLAQIAPQLEELSKPEQQADTPVITITHEGKVYQSAISRKKGFYAMELDGVEYVFGNDMITYRKTHGWHIINSKTLPELTLASIAVELEKLRSK